jgi:hypothetical protein
VPPAEIPHRNATRLQAVLFLSDGPNRRADKAVRRLRQTCVRAVFVKYSFNADPRGLRSSAAIKTDPTYRSTIQRGSMEIDAMLHDSGKGLRAARDNAYALTSSKPTIKRGHP